LLTRPLDAPNEVDGLVECLIHAANPAPRSASAGRSQDDWRKHDEEDLWSIANSSWNTGIARS
jgi:hypothetical protein